MLTITPTATGVGIELRSSIETMNQLYDLTDVILDINYAVQDEPEDNRGVMILSFAYDIRHAIMAAEYPNEQNQLLPCSIKLIWPDIIIYLMCLRQKAAYVTLQPKDLELLDLLENELKRAMYAFDPVAAAVNEHLIQPIFDLKSDYLFLLHTPLHNEYINTKPRKTAFKKLSSLMHAFFDHAGIQRQFIEHETNAYAKKLKCAISKLRSTEEFLEVKRW